MDFAALMSEEISKGKKDTPSKTVSDAQGKYLKRAELELQREAAYRAEQEAIRAQREEKARRKRQAEEDDAQRNQERQEKRQRLAEESRKRREQEEAERERLRRKRLGLPELPPKGEETTPPAEGEEDDVPDEELVTKLREADEPVRLFGESHRQRLRRFRRLNQKTTMGFTTLELVPEEQMKVETVPEDAEGKKFLFRQLASYFSMVLNEWEKALNKRAASVQESFQGKAAYNAMVQARENMRPLFRKFEVGELDVLEAVVEIVKAAQEKRYVDANDGYLRLSIGKA